MQNFGKGGFEHPNHPPPPRYATAHKFTTVYTSISSPSSTPAKLSSKLQFEYSCGVGRHHLTALQCEVWGSYTRAVNLTYLSMWSTRDTQASYCSTEHSQRWMCVTRSYTHCKLTMQNRKLAATGPVWHTAAVLWHSLESAGENNCTVQSM